MKKYLWALLLISVFLFTFWKPNPAYACVGGAYSGSNPKEFLERSDIVFKGTVTRITQRNRLYWYVDDFSGFQIDRIVSPPEMPSFFDDIYFDVDKAWKGVEYQRIVVQSDEYCGHRFVIGHDYLVYASKWNHGFLVGNTNPTKEILNAVDDFAYLNTLPILELSPAPLGFWQWVGLTAIVMGVLGMGGFVLWWQGGRSS